jgi:hypothetical protein
LAGLIAHIRASTIRPRDFTSIWEAARAIVSGHDPYTVAAQTFYPLPGLLAVVPWTAIPYPAGAAGIFMVVSATAFAWALLEHGYGTLLCFFSVGSYFAAEVVQWCRCSLVPMRSPHSASSTS